MRTAHRRGLGCAFFRTNEVIKRCQVLLHQRQREISATARGIASLDFIQWYAQEPLLGHAMWGRVSRLIPSHAPSHAVPRWHHAPILLTRLLVHVGRAVIFICRCCRCSVSRPLAVSTCSVPVARDLCPALCFMLAPSSDASLHPCCRFPARCASRPRCTFRRSPSRSACRRQGHRAARAATAAGA